MTWSARYSHTIKTASRINDSFLLGFQLLQTHQADFKQNTLDFYLFHFKLIHLVSFTSIISTVASNDPCRNYKSLNAADRLETFTGQNPLRCDQGDITPGWYRFTGIAGNPQMPTTCPPVRRCGTHAPGWIKGQHPSVADGEVTREVCYHWTSNCCRWRNNIKVKNCGAFYVYQLQKTPVCSLRYCGE